MAFAILKHDDREQGFNFDMTSRFIIDSESDLASLPECFPGSIAFTADNANTWQMSPAGTWTKVK